MTGTRRPRQSLEELREAWLLGWPQALAAWSRYTQLLTPRWCLTKAEERHEGLTGSFAMIRLVDHAVVISLRQIAERQLEGFGPEIMAHEIGHHVFVPGDLTDQGRLLARTRHALGPKKHLAPFIANLYADLLINDRLQRSANLNLSGVYQALGAGLGDPLWALYMRIYELLWSKPRGTLTPPRSEPELDFDAQLGARLARAHARDWLEGAGRFACLCLPYLLEDDAVELRARLSPLMDTEDAGSGAEVDGLAEIDEDEEAGAIHPAVDPELNGLGEGEEAEETHRPGPAQKGPGGKKSVKRYRGPVEYGELMDALGVGATREEVTARYYEERARPHLIRFPTRLVRQATEPLPEGLEQWDVGSPLEEADWLESVLQSPTVIPGVTTVKRTHGESAGADPKREPVDLYIGIDCSGSMPNPAAQESIPVLAGAILALSALRAGARVKVVLSGEPGRSLSTASFSRDKREVMRVLTSYLGTGYAFGIHRLRESFEGRRPSDRPAHIIVITDSDIFSMLEQEGDGALGWDVAREALLAARGGGTYVLHRPGSHFDDEAARMQAEGWGVHRLADWEDLLTFARDFARRTYQERR